MRYTIYYWKKFDKHFPTQVQSYESVQSFIKYQQTKILQLLMT